MKTVFLFFALTFYWSVTSALEFVVPEKMQETLDLAIGGDPYAQEIIGEVFHYGRGVDRDYKKAFYWYEKSAKQGHAPAQDYLALFYEIGLGVKKDCGKSIEWLRYAYFNGFKESLGNYVWLLATCENEKFRDGKLALKLAKEDLQVNGETISRFDNLAAVYAELGDFEKAINLQEKLVIELSKRDQPKRLLKFRERLKKYKAGEPWRGYSLSQPEQGPQ